jgi:hypothetical protein
MAESFFISSAANLASTVTIAILSAAWTRNPNDRLNKIQEETHNGMELINEVQDMLPQSQKDKISKAYERWVECAPAFTLLI